MNSHRCPLSEEQLTAFLEDDLPARQTRLMARHVITCPSCSQILGRLKAAESLLRTPQPDETIAETSPEFWPRLQARLDDVDHVMNATPGVGRQPANNLRRLALAGAAVIVLALAAQQVMLRHFPALQPAQLAQIHRQAVAAAAPQASTPDYPYASAGFSDAGRSGRADTPPSFAPYLVELDGVPAVCSVYLLDGRRATALCTIEKAIDLRRMAPLSPGQDRYFAGRLPDGNIVLVDTAGQMWRAVISDAPPQQMLSLLMRMPDYQPLRGSM